MRIRQGKITIVLLLVAFKLLIAQSVHAHLMVAQHGTLNVLDNNVYTVLSLPLSAFSGTDDDNDGVISMLEFNHHRAAIVESIRQNITLGTKRESASLEDLILAPVFSHDSTRESVSQLTVMGRFTLPQSVEDLRLHIGLYGTRAVEQSMEITATSKSDSVKMTIELTPAAPSAVVFPAGM